jgi:mannose-6-phosphate isomerase-like protein (cupin superfamily)
MDADRLLRQEVIHDDRDPDRRAARTPTASLFGGGDEVAISVFVTEYEREQGPALHLHPYPEVFVVQTGTAAFTVGDEELTVTGGHFVVAPAQTPRRFIGTGDDTCA